MKPQHFIVFINYSGEVDNIIGVFPSFVSADNFLKNYKTESLSAQIKGWEGSKLIFETWYAKNPLVLNSDFSRYIS